MKNYFYRLLVKYLCLFIRPNDTVLLYSPPVEPLRQLLGERVKQMLQPMESGGTKVIDGAPDYIVISSEVHYQADIQQFFAAAYLQCHTNTRLIVTYYSSLWRPLLSFATFVGLRRKTPEQNWITHEDIKNFLCLSDFEVIRTDQKVLIPFYIPLISEFANKFLVSLPMIRHLTLVNMVMARPVVPCSSEQGNQPSVSVIVPARNEAGNIENIIKRLPEMGPNDELIFIEGHSQDNTCEMIQQMSEKYKNAVRIRIAQQSGKGKGDAVRKGFDMATAEILMILDADMTVAPEELPKFYQAIVQNKGEFINGSRLVYPMEGEAMRFLNMVANKFFALAFSFVIGQRFKDTLCGTKVISRENYRRLAAHRSYFGDFDPFGDFDLIFGAARMGLKIVEVPIAYKNRTYGTTNISRWSHGLLLFRMLAFASFRMRFL